MSVTGALIVPHPPVLMPEVGRGRERELARTEEACREAARIAAGWSPDAVVIISPHATCYADYFHISPGGAAAGDFAAFGAPQPEIRAAYDTALALEIARQARKIGLPAGPDGERDPALDHGTLIPLRFLQQAGLRCPIVRVGLSGLGDFDHYRLGECIAAASASLGRTVALVASGDLSHKLTADGPYGFAPEGPRFDAEVTAAMAEGAFGRFLGIGEQFRGAAAECGLGAFQIMAGALDGRRVQPRLLSYEGPFGVGYAVAVFAAEGEDDSRRFLLALQRSRLDAQKAKLQGDHVLRLAKESLEAWVAEGWRLSLPTDLPAGLAERRAGVFVSLHKEGRLRGCIGTIAPVTNCIAAEIIRNAVLAGTGDPRFDPVRPAELPLLEYSVDLLDPPEPIESPSQLDVKRYGVIVSRGNRRGLLLPNLDGVDTVEEQIRIARQKAGIGPDEPCSLERFQVVRHE